MLAFELGYANVDLMLSQMTVPQFEEWKAFVNWRARQQKKAAQQ